jgi:deoxyribodipyrimidine photo-lyase
VELRTQFANREDMTAYLAEALQGLFSPDAARSSSPDAVRSSSPDAVRSLGISTSSTSSFLRGGRRAALEALQAFTADGYTRRNFVNGGVSRLSAYLRHGVLSITEVADHVRRVARGRDRLEFLKQLAWREFFNLVLEQEGAKVLENLEEPKYSARWRDALPDDVRQASTGLPCVDAWVGRLIGTGYMHNHERLWFAAYLTHWRGIHWKAGYRFFREHLLDGDVASNALSWQWVASTFSSKPYFMNQGNIKKYSDDAYCSSCTVSCPFQRRYDQLERELFGGMHGWTA